MQVNPIYFGLAHFQAYRGLIEELFTISVGAGVSFRLRPAGFDPR